MERKRKPFYAKARNLVRTVLNKQSNDLCDRLKSCGSVQEMQRLADMPMKHEGMQLAIRTIYKETGKHFAEAIINEFGKRKALGDTISEDYWLQYMDNVFKAKLGQRITWISNTTEEVFKNTVKNVTLEGLHTGASIYQMTKDIQKELNLSSIYRAERIARTEVGSASNAASMAGAESVGEDLDKVWMSHIDDRTRGVENDPKAEADHIVMDGEVRGMDAMFSNGLDYPCDPNGDAAEVINCRCTIGYQEKDNTVTFGRTIE